MVGMCLGDPSFRLMDCVEHYWELTQTEIDNGHPIFPRGSIDIIFNIGPSTGYSKILTDKFDPGQTAEDRFTDLDQSSCRHQSTRRAWMVGFHEKPLIVRARLLEARYGVHLVAARLKPTASLALLGIAPGETINRVFELSDLVGTWVEIVREQMMEATSTDARFAILDASLLRMRIDHGRGVKSSIKWIAEQGFSYGGQVKVEDICRTLGISRKHLGQLVKDQIGFTPKKYMRLMRFRRAVDILTATPDSNLTHLAYDLGFTDQAHFIRDFQSFSGISPGQFVKSAGA